jgi:hypothetical protein
MKRRNRKDLITFLLRGISTDTRTLTEDLRIGILIYKAALSAASFGLALVCGAFLLLSHKTVQILSLVMRVTIVTMAAQCVI